MGGGARGPGSNILEYVAFPLEMSHFKTKCDIGSQGSDLLCLATFIFPRLVTFISP
jgi:hypothetical protein